MKERKPMNEMWNGILDDFEMYNNHLISKVVDWYPSGQAEITVKLDDGRKLCYDWRIKRSRFIRTIDDPDGCNDEVEWRSRFAKSLNDRLRKMCASESWLSEVSGISKVTLSKYMTGKSTPSAYNISRLAKALRCSTHELVEF